MIGEDNTYVHRHSSYIIHMYATYRLPIELVDLFEESTAIDRFLVTGKPYVGWLRPPGTRVALTSASMVKVVDRPKLRSASPKRASSNYR